MNACDFMIVMGIMLIDVGEAHNDWHLRRDVEEYGEVCDGFSVR